MTKETILTRITNGETITAEMLAEVQAAEQLTALQAEAARRQQEQDAQRQAQEDRTALINELVVLDRNAESAARFFDSIQKRRLEETQKLDVQELAARAEWHTAFMNFDRKFRELSGLRITDSYQPEVQAVIGELKRKGVKLDKVTEKISDLPLSPSIKMILREREQEQNAYSNIDS